MPHEINVSFGHLTRWVFQQAVKGFVLMAHERTLSMPALGGACHCLSVFLNLSSN
jgi:hypothetical protein